jgi:hypothetical protein
VSVLDDLVCCVVYYEGSDEGGSGSSMLRFLYLFGGAFGNMKYPWIKIYQISQSWLCPLGKSVTRLFKLGARCCH